MERITIWLNVTSKTPRGISLLKAIPNSNPTSQQGKLRVHVLDREDEDTYPLFAVSQVSRKNPYMVAVELNGLEVQMELDTGASLSVTG